VKGSVDFTDCKSLASVTLPDGITNIKSYGCTSLTSLVIPDGVTSINDYFYSESLNWSYNRGTFEDCTNLTSVTIGKGVRSIGDRTFVGCKNLTNIVFRGEGPIQFESHVFSGWRERLPLAKQSELIQRGYKGEF